MLAGEDSSCSHHEYTIRKAMSFTIAIPQKDDYDLVRRKRRVASGRNPA